MKKITSIVLFACLVFNVLGGALVSAAPLVESTYTAGIVSAKDTAQNLGASVTVGETFTVSVDVANSAATPTAFAAAQLDFSYSPNLKFIGVTGSAGDEVAAKADGTRIVAKGIDKNFGSGLYTLTFEALSVGAATVTLEHAAFGTSIEAETLDLVPASISPATLTFAVVPPSYLISLGEEFASDQALTVQEGQNFVFKAETSTGAYYDYAAPIATLTGTQTEVPVESLGYGYWIVRNVSGNLTIRATRTPKTYSVGIFGTAAGVSLVGNNFATYLSDYSFIIPKSIAPGVTAGVNYAVVVTVGGRVFTDFVVREVAAGVEYTIPGADVRGNIVIELVTMPVPVTRVGVFFLGNAAGAAGGNATTAIIGDDYVLTLAFEQGFDYTVKCAVGADGEAITLQPDRGTVNRYTIPDVSAKLTFTIEKTVRVTGGVSVDEYLTLNDGNSMWLVTVRAPKLNTSAVAKTYTYTYSNTPYTTKTLNMYYSEKYEGYCTLVIAEKAPEMPSAANVSIVSVATAPEVVYDCNVNGSTGVDANDAQLIYKMYMSEYTSFTANVPLEKFLRADINGNKKVNMADALAVIHFLFD